MRSKLERCFTAPFLENSEWQDSFLFRSIWQWNKTLNSTTFFMEPTQVLKETEKTLPRSVGEPPIVIWILFRSRLDSRCIHFFLFLRVVLGIYKVEINFYQSPIISTIYIYIYEIQKLRITHKPRPDIGMGWWGKKTTSISIPLWVQTLISDSFWLSLI